MNDPTLTPDERYARLAEEFAAEPGVTLPGGATPGKGFGADALKVNEGSSPC